MIYKSVTETYTATLSDIKIVKEKMYKSIEY